jgi:hypothetical protein
VHFLLGFTNNLLVQLLLRLLLKTINGLESLLGGFAILRIRSFGVFFIRTGFLQFLMVVHFDFENLLL